MIFYKMYPYSVKATLCSVCFSILALVFAFLTFLSFSAIENTALKIIAALFCLVAAVFCFTYLSRELPDKIAQKEFNEKIRTNAKYAYRYCIDHPEHFAEIAAENPAFAEKYELNEKGKVVKKK